MISKDFVYNKVLPLVLQKHRKIDYYLIQSIYENKDDEILTELLKYQNKDGGFGNSLEPDVRMEESSVLATATAIKVLDSIRDKEKSKVIREHIVSYLESVYDTKRNGFKMVSKEVDNYPRAIWWNYKDLESNFPYGNPDPEIVGFLYENREFIKTLNLLSLINKVIDFVKSDSFLSSGMHTLLSTMYFYKRMDKDIKNLIHDRLHELVTIELDKHKDNYSEYGLEPYKVFVVDAHFVNTHLIDLGKNLAYNLDKVKNLEVKPNWEWHQYEKESKQAMLDWTGYLYFQIIKALKINSN